MNDNIYLLSESYNSNEALRLLVKLIPYGSLIDSKLIDFYTKEKERRLKIFYDKLAKENIDLSEETIQSDDFLHKYFITLKAALESNREQKIQYFANLLKNSQSILLNRDTDYYDDFVKVLDDLTFQEIFILLKLREYEKEYEHLAGRPMMIGKRFYREFKKYISAELDISEDETLSIFIRLGRTGCVNFDKNMFMSNEVHDVITTTDFFKKLETLSMTDSH